MDAWKRGVRFKFITVHHLEWVKKTTPIVSVKLPHRWVEEKTHPTQSSIPNSGTGVGHESTAHHSEIFEDGIGECPILDISPKTRMGQKVIEKWQNGIFQMEKKRRMMENVVYMVFIDFQGSHCFFLHFFKTHFPCKTDLDLFFQRFWNNFGGLFSGPGSSSIWWCWDPIGWGTWEKSWTWSKMNKDYRDPVTCFDET